MIWSPMAYQSAAVIAEEARAELLERLALIKLNPAVIIDLGSGLGELSQALAKRFVEAKIINLDLSSDMLSQQVGTQEKILGNAEYLPFKSESADFITANLLFPWLESESAFLRECRRVLKPNGLILFSLFGPETLKELKLTSNELPKLMDMHDIGDYLIQEKFQDPVADVNYYTLVYKDFKKLETEMLAFGMVNNLNKLNNLETTEDFRVTYEVIFVHAFKPEITQREGETFIPVKFLKQQLSGK